MGRQKGEEIGLGNPHQPVNAVRDEPAAFYPPPDSALVVAHELGDLGDGVEFHRRFLLVGFHCTLMILIVRSTHSCQRFALLRALPRQLALAALLAIRAPPDWVSRSLN
jgi:hypothetical protein